RAPAARSRPEPRVALTPRGRPLTLDRGRALTFEAPRQRSRILTAVMALLFLVGALPLALFGWLLTGFNRERLELQQKEHQLALAEAIALEVGEFVRARRAAVQGFSHGLEAALVVSDPAATLAAVQDKALLNRYLEEDPDLAKLVFATRAPDQASGGL